MFWNYIKKRLRKKQSQPVEKQTTARKYEQDTGRVTHKETQPQIWETQFGNVPENARSTLVIIGLDFGTAFTKVVISGAGQKYGVPLNNNKQGTEKYLLPTCLYEDSKGNYSIENPLDCQRFHTDLKMQLLDNTLDSSEKDRIIHYIAQVLQRSRHWLMTEKQNVFHSERLLWYVNIGLPTEIDGDNKLKNTYKELVGEAWYSSTEPHFKGESPNDSERKLHPERIGVFPEFVAQVQGYISSPQRKHGVHFLVDVGAATLDATFFMVHRHEGENKHPILDGSVEKYGTTYLIRHRCKELGHQNSWRPNSLGRFPTNDEFVDKLNVTLEEIQSCDKKFRKQIIDHINLRREFAKRKTADIQPEWNEGVPMMLCGGGARVDFYREEIVSILTGQKFHRLRLPAFSESLTSDIDENDSDRLSVAYGLSFGADDLGEISRPREITPSQSPKRTCPRCNGKGGLHTECPKCGGSGFVQ